MKLGKAIKKVAALAAGTSMLGATMMGALAADLSDYPSPFVKDGVFSGMIVVGEKAATADVVGAIDIASSLQSAAVTQVPVTVSGAGITVTGGASEEIALNAQVLSEMGPEFDDGDIVGLFDGKIEVDDDEVDVHEEFFITSGMVVKTNAGGGDDEFGAEPRLVFDQDDVLGYRIVFDDSVTEGEFEDPVKAAFLGKQYSVTALNITGALMASDEPYAKIKASEEYYMTVGGSLDIKGHTVTVRNIGGGSPGSAVVDVDGQTKVIEDGKNEKFNEAGGLKVQVESIFYDEAKEDRSCTIIVGDEIEMTVENGDPAELFGEPDDANDAEWLWDIGATTEGKGYAGVVYNQKRQKVGDAYEPLKVGEKISFPNDYGYISFDSLITDNYETITVEMDNVGLESEDFDVVAFRSTGEESFRVRAGAGFADTDEVWVLLNATESNNFTVWYKDDSDEKQSSWDNFTITLDGEDLLVEPAFGANWTITMPNSEVISMNIQTGSGDNGTATNGLVFDHFGAIAEEAEAADVYLGSSTIGTKDEDWLTSYGLIFVDNEGNLDADILEMKIPDEQQKARIIMASSGTSVAGTSGSATSDKVNPIPVGLGVLDKDATVGSSNLIVIGGPCANTVAAELLDNPVPCADGFEVGKAKLKMFQSGSKVSLLVAGYNAVDTVAASKILADYEDYAADLSGMEVEVITSTNKVTSIQ